MLANFVRNVLIAVQFFTRIPISGGLGNWVGYSPARLKASAAHFPGVGWIVGAIGGAAFLIFYLLLPQRPSTVWLAAVICISVCVLLTGAFHEDGLADTADGLGGGFTRDRALEIMKDSRIGTYGAIALVLSTTTRISILALLAEVDVTLAAIGFFGASVTSRFAPLVVIKSMPHVGDTPTSKSKPLAESIGIKGLLTGAIWWSAALFTTHHWISFQTIVAGVAGASFGLTLMMWRLRVRLQGFTGDGLGATQQLAEIGFGLGMLVSIGTT